MAFEEIRAAESSDPLRIVADAQDGTGEPIAEAGELLTAGGTLLEQDLIAKANAGAQLTFAVWSLPKDVVFDLFKNAPTAFTKAYTAACEAYGVGGH